MTKIVPTRCMQAKTTSIVGARPVGRPGGYGPEPAMIWEFLRVAMTAFPGGADGASNQNDAPPAT